jgi:hypothetical protein
MLEKMPRMDSRLRGNDAMGLNQCTLAKSFIKVKVLAPFSKPLRLCVKPLLKLPFQTPPKFSAEP